MDLVRKILLTMEEHGEGFAPHPFAVENHTDEEVGYHIYLMADAGLLTGEDSTHLGCTSPRWMPSALTWAGHEFLDAARNDSVWAKVKSTFKSLPLAVLQPVLKDYLIHEAKRVLNLPG